VTLSPERVASLLSDPGAIRIRESERGSVWRVQLEDGHEGALKIDRPPTLRSRWGAALRGSRAARARRAALALQAAGFLAPEPLALLEEARRSVLLSRWIEGPTLSAAWASASRAEALTLARATGELSARLHQAGFRCRDLKPPNLIVSPSGLALVDLDDVRTSAHVPMRLRRRNLSVLDAYGQVSAAPLGVRARSAGLHAYCALAQLEPRAELGPLLTKSRRKRAKLLQEQGASACP